MLRHTEELGFSLAYSDERWLYYQFSLRHLYISLWRVGRMYSLNLGVKGLNWNGWVLSVLCRGKLGGDHESNRFALVAGPLGFSVFVCADFLFNRVLLCALSERDWRNCLWTYERNLGSWPNLSIRSQQRSRVSLITKALVEWMMDGWMEGWMEGRKEGRKDGWMGGWKDGWMDGWMDGWVEGWMDG